MDAPKFYTVKELIKELQQMPQNAAVGIETVDGMFVPLMRSSTYNPSCYVEGYGVDFMVLEADFEYQIERTAV